MRKRFFGWAPWVAVLGLLLVTTARPDEKERKWYAPDGRYWIGKLLDVEGDRVHLERPNGERGTISLSKLREPDQRYIARFVARREEEARLGPEQMAREAKLAEKLADEPREWTNQKDQTITGLLEDFDGTEVQLRTKRGVYRFPAVQLSEFDRRLLRKWRANSPVQVGEWPESVEAPKDLEIEFVEGGVGEWGYAYRSPHFEFRTSTRLSVSVVREFARLFEATFGVVKALPVGLKPAPHDGGYFITELFETRQEYLDAGGPQGSGGVYMTSEDKIMIPMPALGVERVGNRWILETREDNATLQHEITHQVTRRWLPFWPVWFTEGIAEYVSSARYNKGRYTLNNMAGRVEDAIMTYPVDENYFPMVDLETLMTISNAEWSAALTTGDSTYNYRSANVLMYYFLHLDGEGDGAGVATYLRALDQGVDSATAASKNLLRGRSFAELSEEVHERLRDAGLRIEFR